jgi:hypothetical protein
MKTKRKHDHVGAGDAKSLRPETPKVNDNIERPQMDQRELMTRPELAILLRLDQISKAECDRIINDLERTRSFPTLHIGKRRLYWLPMVRHWLRSQFPDKKVAAKQPSRRIRLEPASQMGKEFDSDDFRLSGAEEPRCDDDHAASA